MRHAWRTPLPSGNFSISFTISSRAEFTDLRLKGLAPVGLPVFVCRAFLTLGNRCTCEVKDR